MSKVSRRVVVERRRIAGANETTPALASQMSQPDREHQLIITLLTSHTTSLSSKLRMNTNSTH